tara:strand:- start:124 stop:765 length:642 start_codon:yes stop_codon:yes gene_type:complete
MYCHSGDSSYRLKESKKMKSVYNYVIRPEGGRYNNTKKVGDKNLILNTEIFNHQYINRKATVISTPIVGSTDIEVGNDVIVHHNVFRRWHNIRGEEKNSKSYFNENTYLITEDQIFLYKKFWEWKAVPGYCFVKPIKSFDKFNIDQEQPLMGIIEYSDGVYSKGDLVGFTPNSEYEFIINGQKLYRVYTKFITIKYEYQGHEEAYNPSWAQSS